MLHMIRRVVLLALSIVLNEKPNHLDTHQCQCFSVGLQPIQTRICARFIVDEGVSRVTQFARKAALYSMRWLYWDY